MPDVLPVIKRGSEGVLLLGESPAKKKSKSAIISQYTSARVSSSTARDLLTTDAHQLQFEHEGKDHVREILKLYHYQLSKYDNQPRSASIRAVGTSCLTESSLSFKATLL